ncbi:MAG: ATP-dependent helicase DeaD [Patescibacteria group bacterium]|nr:ATP-dependent helicase DeaD [Patescibacteria group bacterium]
MYRQNTQSGRSNSRPSRGGYGGGYGGRQRNGFGGGNSRPNFRRQPKKNNIDVSLFINAAQEAPEQEVHPIQHSFSDFPLHEKLHKSIEERGYTIPTPIQDQAIQSILDGRDLLGIANTGTGKTGAFLIPIINKILNDYSQKALIMVPTRELALQIDRELRALTGGLNIFSVMSIGGTSMYNQQRDLQRRHNVVIGTPGRLKDLIQRNQLNLSQFNTVVLDEVDQMLDMGFIHDMREILKHMPRERQSLFFSATMTKPVQILISDFSHDLVSVSVKTVETASTIDQDIVRFEHPEKKLEVLHELLNSEGFEKVLIFGRTKRGVHKLSVMLNDRGFRSESIHGNKTQPQRQRALKRFHYNEVKILVATDVAARGLDILDVTHVINYDLPETYEDYVHRIGRTGRANKRGKALTFVGNE